MSLTEIDMKREIVNVTHPGRCCPGHDKYPNATYKNRRSTKARARDMAKEHRHARRVVRADLKNTHKE